MNAAKQYNKIDFDQEPWLRQKKAVELNIANKPGELVKILVIA